MEGRTVHLPDVLADPECAFPKRREGRAIAACLASRFCERIADRRILLMRRMVQPFADKQIELVRPLLTRP